MINKELIEKDLYVLDQEIKTNMIWINNKPIYRKIVKLVVESNTQGQISLSNINYDTIWVNHGKSFCQYGGSLTSSGTNWMNNNKFDDYGLSFINAQKILNIKNTSSANRTYYVCLEYTKTTD